MGDVQLAEFLKETRELMLAIRAEQLEQSKKLAVIAKRSWKASRKEKKV